MSHKTVFPGLFRLYCFPEIRRELQANLLNRCFCRVTPELGSLLSDVDNNQ